METIDIIQYRGFEIKTYPDLEPTDPRSWDNMGTMVCFHKRYDLGDKHDLNSDNFDGWDKVREHLEKEMDAWIILPLYMYDHSGIRIKVGSFQGLLPQGHAEFDSGMIGFIYVTREQVRDTFMVKRITKKIKDRAEYNLKAEVETYDEYVSGQVYGYDSDAGGCWGYHDYDYMVEEAKSEIDHHIRAELVKHYKILKAYIKQHIPLIYRTACPIK